MYYKLLMILITLLISADNAMCCLSSYSSEVHSLDWREDYCVKLGTRYGYHATEAMAPYNHDAAADPYIEIRQSDCFFGCIKYEIYKLRDGERLWGGLWYCARKETIGAYGDGSICWDNDESCDRKNIEALCVYHTVGYKCSRSLPHYLMKCLPIPMAKAPPPCCSHIVNSLVPKLVYVSRSNGNSYITPKVKIMAGDKYKTCFNDKGQSLKTFLTDSEITNYANRNESYPCTKAGFKTNKGNFEKPKFEKILDLDSPEKGQTTSYDIEVALTDATVPMKVAIDDKKICLEDKTGSVIECINRVSISEHMPKHRIGVHNNRNTIQVSIFDGIKYHNTSVRILDDNKIKHNDFDNFNGLSLYAFKARVMSNDVRPKRICLYDKDDESKTGMVEYNEDCDTGHSQRIKVKHCDDNSFVYPNETCKDKTGTIEDGKLCEDGTTLGSITTQCVQNTVKYVNASNPTHICIAGLPTNKLFDPDTGTSYMTSERRLFKSDNEMIGVSIFDQTQAMLDTGRSSGGDGLVLYDADDLDGTRYQIRIVRARTSPSSSNVLDETNYFSMENNSPVYMTVEQVNRLRENLYLDNMCTPITIN